MPKQSTFAYLRNLDFQKIVSTVMVEADSAFLGVVIGKKTVYIPIEHVYKVASNLSITKVCHTKELLEGIAQVDGNIYSIFNLGRWIDIATNSGLRGNNTVVALSQTNGYYALLVEETLGISHFRLLGVPSETPLTLDYKESNGGVISVLSVEKLVNSSEFSDFSIFKTLE